MLKKCGKGANRCGLTCVKRRSNWTNNSRCRKGTRRCPRKTGSCRNWKK